MKALPSRTEGHLERFHKQFFGEKTEDASSASHFQFTEPSAEVDVSCVFCNRAAAACVNTVVDRSDGLRLVNPKLYEIREVRCERYTGLPLGRHRALPRAEKQH
jgi:phenylalanyl-tRNA synthetase alpha chain